ncbi:MAG: hydantoinase B/oxoprolinase family protein [Chloroflexi bacterium]|nr:hydantoinase B/oxoprolinase family protein [Chloroflexota bacterium]
MPVDPVSLEVFRNLLTSVAEEMGVALGRTAFSPNIKERRDYSCALFAPQGSMVAQAAHIPVHLGSMPASVQAALEGFAFQPGDIVILNDPYMGGTHLPDITLVMPVFFQGDLSGFVANRGHHADVGGMTPGSLPLSTDLFQEGLIIPPVKLAEGGRIVQQIVDLLCRNSRSPEERKGDLAAQIAACRTGERRFLDILAQYGLETVQEHMRALLDYSERLIRAAVREVPDGLYTFRDFMDDDGFEDEPVPIQVAVRVQGDEMEFDFSGSAPERPGCINAPLAVTRSAVLYVVLCLAGEAVPPNDGVMRPIKVHVPEGSLLNPRFPAAVAGGNVETSQRVVDVLLGAMAQAVPRLIPAASQGTMNNVLVGGHDPVRGKSFAYYETLAGGMGGRPDKEGLSAVHTHMTNTLNTPIEALESNYPFRILRYQIRRGSGGRGLHPGGDGLVRDMQFLSPAVVTVLSERRRSAPYGLQGGEPGAPGENLLLRGGVEEVRLPPKFTIQVEDGDTLSIHTPGGGGWGKPK